MTTKFREGDRVERKGRHGRVTHVYSQPFKRSGGLLLGPYPELYDVLWDNDSEITKGYLPHGLEPMR